MNSDVLQTPTIIRHNVTQLKGNLERGSTALFLRQKNSKFPQFLIQLIQDLHTGTTSRVRVGKRLSKAFYTSSGVRQGCVLAPALFCLASDWIMSRCSGNFGIILGGQCLLTWTMQMMRYFLHRIQEGGRQNSSVSTMPQPLWVCTLRGKIQNYRTSVMVLHLNQSLSMDTLCRSLTSLSTWAALLIPLVTLSLTFFDESALHH